MNVASASIPDGIESASERRRATWRGPRSFTCLLPAAHDDFDALRRHFEAREERVAAAVSRAEGVHSLRISAAPPEAGGARRPRALLNVVHDQPLPELLAELFGRAGAELEDAFSPLEGPPARSQWPSWLARRRLRENTLHIGAVNATVREIHAEKSLRQIVEAFADERLASGAWDARTRPERMAAEIRDQVMRSTLDPAVLAPRAGVSLRGRVLRAVDRAVTFLFPAFGVLVEDALELVDRRPTVLRRALRSALFSLWWLYAAAPTAAALAVVRIVEAFEDEAAPPVLDEERWARLEAREDRFVHNEVTLWLPVRDSLARRLLLRLILWGAERGCRHLWDAGELAGIGTIHHARILQLDGGRTMAFLSDYDGGLDRYLEDFIGVGSRAVVPISSNLAHCPKTSWLFGRADRQRFAAGWRAMIRAHQLETSIWYGAYRDTSVREILANRALRDEMHAASDGEDAARRWLRRL